MPPASPRSSAGEPALSAARAFATIARRRMPTPPSDFERPPAPLLDAADLVLIALLTAVGMGLRLAWFGGYGLGDDVLIRHAASWFLDSGLPPGANYGYRFAWWGPTALAAAGLGVTEWAMVLPVVLAAAAAFPLVYGLGAALWGRTGGIVSAALLAVVPLDFAWSTMVTPDIVCSTLLLACMLAIVRAAAPQTPAARRRLLAVAALTAWLGFHVKISAGLMGLPILATFWVHRQALGRDLAVFFGVSAVLFGMTTFTAFALTGDPLFPYTSEVVAQGLRGPDAVAWHRLTWPVFMHFPRAVFFADQYGNVLFAGLPWVVVLAGLLGLLGPGPGFRLRAPELWWWVLVLALGLQFNIQRAGDDWVAGFRNVRHLHGLVHPVVLIAAGALLALRARSRRAFAIAFGGLVAFGLWHSSATARLTHVSFADRRAACRALVALPPKPIHTDFQIRTGCAIEPRGVELQVVDVPSLPGEERTRVLASLGDVYVVTGGGREPHYGCVDCIPLAAELEPERWRLLFEGPEGPPPTKWRAERVRIWERIPETS